MATHIKGSSATCTGTCVSLLRRSSKSLSNAPPPASIIPRSMMSEASSGGVRSRVSRTAATIASTGTLIASRTSSLAAPPPDVHDHGSRGLVARYPRPYCRRQRLLNGVRLPRSSRLRRLLYRPKLHARDSTRDAHHDPRPGERTQDPALRLRFAYEVREHLLCDLEVGYDPVLQGAHGHNVAGRAPEHPLGRRPHGDDLVS